MRSSILNSDGARIAILSAVAIVAAVVYLNRPVDENCSLGADITALTALSRSDQAIRSAEANNLEKICSNYSERVTLAESLLARRQHCPAIAPQTKGGTPVDLRLDAEFFRTARDKACK